MDRILEVSNAKQGMYVPANKNPADLDTRCVAAKDIEESTWLCGPTDMCSETMDSRDESFPLVDPDKGTEVRPVVTTLKSETSEETHLGVHRLEMFSSWRRLVIASSLLRQIAHQRMFNIQCEYKSVLLFGSTISYYL